MAQLGTFSRSGVQNVLSRAAEGTIEFGTVVQKGTADTQVKAYAGAAGTKQVQTLTFSAALVTSNVVNGRINDRDIADITFATDSNTTLAALATEIARHENVLTATVTDAGGGTDDDRVIVVTTRAPGVELNLTGFAVTAGASQATVTVAETTASLSPQPPLGFAIFDPTKGWSRDADGNPTQVRRYSDGDACGVIRKGTIYAKAAAAVTAGQTAAVVHAVGDTSYVIGDVVSADTDMGTGEAKVIPAQFVTSGAAAATVELDCNFPG